MQVFTKLPFTPDDWSQPNLANAQPESPRDTATARADHAQPARHRNPLWPDYFARRGQPDATSWHYRGYWSDCRNVWHAYYAFMLGHPWIAFLGLRQFFQTLVYRLFGETVGDRSSLVVTLLTPVLVLLTPVLALLGVCIASIPACKRLVPPLFQPFTVMGWTNYCIMLALVFTLHGYRQQRCRMHPALPMRHSSKLFWNEFFTAELPENQFATHIYAVCRCGALQGQLPPHDILIKPVAAGAGHHLRSLRWDAAHALYRNNDIERPAHEPAQFTQAALEEHLCAMGVDMLVERLESTRAPLPVSTLRILTLCIDGKAELICAAFLPAPNGSVSTAYFDLDAYLVDYEQNTIGAPLASRSTGQLTGLAIPELAGIVDTCLQLHDKLTEHVEISWDVLPAAQGPVFLEGNVFPPGCDYKLTLFKDPANFRYLRDRIMVANRVRT
jgi:hypothetical protein